MWEPRLWFHPVTPRSRRYRDITATYIRRSKYPHIYTLSISTGKNQSTKVRVHYTIQHMSTIIKLSQDVTQYYKNITSPIGVNVRIQSGIQSWTVQRMLTSHKGKTREPSRRPGRIGLWTVCWWSMLLLCISDQQPGESTSSEIWAWGSRGVKTPNEWCGEC